MIKRDPIAVIAPCPFFIDRGTPIRVKRLATVMAAEFDIHVITFHQGNDGDFPFQIHRSLPVPLKIKRSGANLAKVINDFFLLLAVANVVRRENIRVIDAHLHEGAFIGLLVSFFTGARVIYNAHGTFVRELVATGALREDSWLVKPLTYFENMVERRADQVVAQSQLRCDEFVANGMPREKVAVVEDVPELDDLYLSESQADRDLEQQLRPNGEKLLIYAGGMETYQGVDFLLAAFHELAKARNDVKLVLFGRPLAEYRVQAERYGDQNRIVFVDHEPYERLPQYLHICDIGFALRLYGENVPGKLPIYMASGIAVVGTDIKGINSVITDGKNGALVPPGDVSFLASKISWLLDDDAMVKKLGNAGREEALRRYSPEAVQEELGRVYRKLLQG